MKQSLSITYYNNLPALQYGRRQLYGNSHFIRSLLVLSLFLVTITGALAQDKLLGLTATGGPQFAGTAFSINSNGTGFTLTHGFAKSGSVPWGDLAKGPDGNYYGMTEDGGQKSSGVIFRMTPTGTITIMRHLDYYNGGANGYGTLTLGNDGFFYGITYYGGDNGAGTIFKVSTQGDLSVLHHLDAGTDGGYSYGSLVKGTDGNFYGMTRNGGTHDAGTIFKITPAGVFKVLRHLNLTTDGGKVYGSLVQGNDGYFYGMTPEGGTNNDGTIFKINTAGSFTKLRNLNRSTDGSTPNGSLIKGTDGNFYGMTYNGGANDYGTIFRLTPGNTFTVRRHLDYATGSNPLGSLVQGTDGHFYGMTYAGGNGYGVIFKLASGNTYSVLRYLNGTSDGQSPIGSLIQGSMVLFTA